MDVLVKILAARQAVRAVGPEQFLGIQQFRRSVWPRSGGTADLRIDFAVGAKLKRVPITGPLEPAAGLVRSPECPATLRSSKRQIGELVVNPDRPLECLAGGLPLSRALGRHSGVIGGLPLRQFSGAEIGTMRGGEWRTIPQVGRNGAKNHV